MKTLTRPALLVGAALALSACGSARLPPAPENQPPVAAVRGEIANWAGTGTVTLPGPAGQALASAEVAADGSFSLALPTEGALTGAGALRDSASALAQLGCTGTLSSSTPAARGYGFLALNARSSAQAQTIVAATVDFSYLPPRARLQGYAWLYADQATRLTGTLDCGNLLGLPRAAVTVNVQAKQGWNVLGIVLDASSGLGGISARGTIGDTADTRTVWRDQSGLIEW
ncbi:hypothetical protein [Deinococcus budaensis]|uniref:Lipoprotein n=1 Tax=Deinococcus budaensis TaxID=1665626 RepID=A0A7W8LNN6_9DEIO|nr:hypothetical protein [Deinococcus budaensis]MBB5232819.1 hypothetical protein [Deinococcus budaensis]